MGTEGWAETAAPEEELELVHAYGFAGHAAPRLAAFNARGDAVWAAGSLAVVQRTSASRPLLPAAAPPHPLQRFFCGHAAPISALARHPAGRLFASADGGPGPVFVWDSCGEGAATAPIRRLAAVGGAAARGGAGVGAVAFGLGGAAVVTVARDTAHTVHVWDWARAVLLAAAPGGVSAVLAVACGSGPRQAEMVTCGVGQVLCCSWLVALYPPREASSDGRALA